MYVQKTYAALVLLTAAMFVLRFFWWRLPQRIQSALLWFGGVSAILPALSIVTKWSITSDRANTLLNWIAIAGYQLILMRFSLIRPQWLTSFCSFVLLLPIFGASLLFPLTEIFRPRVTTAFQIEGPYLGERTPSETSGTSEPECRIYDIRLYYRPRFAPFLKHRLQRSAFNTLECDASRSTAIVLHDSDEVQFHCPAKSGKPALDHVLPLSQP
ncbi:MAG TPA: hypothetical protein VF214_03645 [Edaphobacter sp.]